MSNLGLTKNYVAEAAVQQYRLAKFGTADGQIIHAVDGAAPILGNIVQPGASAIGDRVDVQREAIGEVELGGTVTRGDPLTAGAAGVGVAAAPGAGVNAYIVGFAEVSGVSGDIIPFKHAPGRIQG